MRPFLDQLTPLATIAVAAAEGKKTAASVDSRWVGELFQAVGTLAKRLAVGAVREAATVYVKFSSVIHVMDVGQLLRVLSFGFWAYLSFLLFWAMTLAARVAMRMARYLILYVKESLCLRSRFFKTKTG